MTERRGDCAGRDIRRMSLCIAHLAVCLDVDQLTSGDFHVLSVRPFLANLGIADRGGGKEERSRKGVYQGTLSGVDEEGRRGARWTSCHRGRRTVGTCCFTDPELEPIGLDLLQVNWTSRPRGNDSERYWRRRRARRRRRRRPRRSKRRRNEDREKKNKFEHLSTESSESKKELGFMEGKCSLLKYMRLSRYGIGHVYGTQKWPAGYVPANKLFSEKTLFTPSQTIGPRTCATFGLAVTTWPGNQPHRRQPASGVYLVGSSGPCRRGPILGSDDDLWPIT